MMMMMIIIIITIIMVNVLYFVDAEYRIWYSDSVQTRRSGVRILAEARDFSLKRPEPAVDPSPSPIPWVPRIFLGGESAGA